jgi:hypothetical protein
MQRVNVHLFRKLAVAPPVSCCLACHRHVSPDAETLRRTVQRLNSRDEKVAYAAERAALLKENADIRDVADLSIGEIRRLRAILLYIRSAYAHKVAYLTEAEKNGGLFSVFSNDAKVAMTADERIDARETLWKLVDQFPAQAPYIVDVMTSLRLFSDEYVT